MSHLRGQQPRWHTCLSRPKADAVSFFATRVRTYLALSVWKGGGGGWKCSVCGTVLPLKRHQGNAKCCLFEGDVVLFCLGHQKDTMCVFLVGGGDFETHTHTHTPFCPQTRLFVPGTNTWESYLCPLRSRPSRWNSLMDGWAARPESQTCFWLCLFQTAPFIRCSWYLVWFLACVDSVDLYDVPGC